MSPPHRTLLGLDVGGSKTAIVEGTVEGEILQRSEVPTQAARPFAETWPGLEQLIRQTEARAAADGRRVGALSVSIGGPLRIAAGVLIEPPHLPGWHHLDLRRHLENRFPELPICIEHDGNAGALAELHFGVGRDRPALQHLVFLTCGTGLGAGIIVHRRVLRGASDTAGEVGHWRVSERGASAFGKTGSWEALASGAAMLNLARRRFPHRYGASATIRELVDAMLREEPGALDIVVEAGRWLGHGIALLLDALNPEVIVLGSLAVALGDRLLGPAREVAAREALPQAYSACQIVPAFLGPRLGDTAALMAALADAELFRRLTRA